MEYKYESNLYLFYQIMTAHWGNSVRFWLPENTLFLIFGSSNTLVSSPSTFVSRDTVINYIWPNITAS
jgi:hypothetical protein